MVNAVIKPSPLPLERAAMTLVGCQIYMREKRRRYNSELRKRSSRLRSTTRDNMQDGCATLVPVETTVSFSSNKWSSGQVLVGDGACVGNYQRYLLTTTSKMTASTVGSTPQHAARCFLYEPLPGRTPAVVFLECSQENLRCYRSRGQVDGVGYLHV